MANRPGDPRFENPAHWSAPAEWAPPAPATSAPSLASPGAHPEAVDDAGDPIDVAASPAAWLSGRALLIATILVAVLLVATVVGSLLYWHTPPLHAIPVPVVPKA